MVFAAGAISVTISSVNGPIAMGYVEHGFTAVGTPLQLIVRDKPMPASVVALPFVPHRYAR